MAGLGWRPACRAPLAQQQAQTGRGGFARAMSRATPQSTTVSASRAGAPARSRRRRLVRKFSTICQVTSLGKAETRAAEAVVASAKTTICGCSSRGDPCPGFNGSAARAAQAAQRGRFGLVVQQCCRAWVAAGSAMSIKGQVGFHGLFNFQWKVWRSPHTGRALETRLKGGARRAWRVAAGSGEVCAPALGVESGHEVFHGQARQPASGFQLGLGGKGLRWPTPQPSTDRACRGVQEGVVDGVARASCVKACALGVACATALVIHSGPLCVNSGSAARPLQHKMAQSSGRSSASAGQPVVFMRGIVLTYGVGHAAELHRLPDSPFGFIASRAPGGAGDSNHPLRKTYADQRVQTPGSECGPRPPAEPSDSIERVGAWA